MMVLRRKQSARIRILQRGFTLLEVLLSIGILAGLLTVGSYIIGQYTRLIINEKAASQMLQVQNAGEEFTRTNFTQLIDGATANNIAAPGSSRIITVADMVAENFLPANFPDTNALRLRMQVYLRNNTKVGIGSLPSIEVITVTFPQFAGDVGQPFQWLADTAQFGKGKLGILSNIGGAYDNISFRSTSNQWRVPLNDLAGYAPPLPASASDPSGYVAAYGVVKSEDIFDNNILYRIPVIGQTQLNQMDTELNMNGHELTDVGTMTIDNVQASALTLNKAGGYAFTSTDGINVTGDTNLNGNMTVYADNDPGTNDFSAVSASLPAGTVSTNRIDTINLDVSNTLVSNNLTTNNSTSRDMIVNTGMNLSNADVVTSTLQIGSTGASAFTTNTLTAQRYVAGSADVSNNYRALTNGTHQVTNNMGIGSETGTVTIRTMAAQEVRFGNLCYEGGAADDIEQCP